MHSIYTFEKGDVEFVDARGQCHTEDCLNVNVSVGDCGRHLKGIAHITEADGPCPKIMITKPLGIAGVKEIIALFEARKAAAVKEGT